MNLPNLSTFLLASSLAVNVILAPKGKAQYEPTPPPPKNYFNDFVHIVQPQTANELDSQLAQLDRDTTNQVIVVIYPHMVSDMSIDSYTLRLFNLWGVGQKGRNNGVALFLFTEERKLRIQVGFGLAKTLPNSFCQQIIDEKIAPLLRKGNFDDGIRSGVTAIIMAIRSGPQRTNSFHP
jgi:uncharacterized protein